MHSCTLCNPIKIWVEAIENEGFTETTSLEETTCVSSQHKSYHIKSQQVLNASYGPRCQLNPTFYKSNHQVKGGVIALDQEYT